MCSLQYNASNGLFVLLKKLDRLSSGFSLIKLCYVSLYYSINIVFYWPVFRDESFYFYSFILDKKFYILTIGEESRKNKGT